MLANQKTVDAFKSLVTEINKDIIGKNHTSRWTNDISGPKIQLLLKLEILTQMPTFTTYEFIAFLVFFQSIYEIKRHPWNFFCTLPHSAQKFQGWLKEHFPHPLPTISVTNEQVKLMCDMDLWDTIQDMADNIEEKYAKRSSCSPD